MCLWISALSSSELLAEILGFIIAKLAIEALGEESNIHGKLHVCCTVLQSLAAPGSCCSSGTEEKERLNVKTLQELRISGQLTIVIKQ